VDDDVLASARSADDEGTPHDALDLALGQPIGLELLRARRMRAKLRACVPHSVVRIAGALDVPVAPAICNAPVQPRVRALSWHVIIIARL